MLRWLLLLAVPLASPALAVEEVASFGSNPGALRMYEHLPANAETPMPLVLVLHGCTQAHGYADAVGLLDLAEQHGFALVLAEQDGDNNSSSCFNWFEAGDITRGQGEALSLVQMVDDMKARHSIDDQRVFVTGPSAGGAMTAVMLATYPDVFAGGAVFAGVSYRCGTGLAPAFDCMSNGSGDTREVMAQRVRDASSWSGPWPRVQIWHGDADTTVDVDNGADLAQQWSGVHGLPSSPSTTGTLGPANRSVWRVGGSSMVELVEVPGMNHGTPVDPGAGPGQCGTAGAFVLDVNLCASAAVVSFFGLDEGGEGEGEGDAEARARGCACDHASGHSSAFAMLGLLALQFLRRR